MRRIFYLLCVLSSVLCFAQDEKIEAEYIIESITESKMIEPDFKVNTARFLCTKRVAVVKSNFDPYFGDIDKNCVHDVFIYEGGKSKPYLLEGKSATVEYHCAIKGLKFKIILPEDSELHYEIYGFRNK